MTKIVLAYNLLINYFIGVAMILRGDALLDNVLYIHTIS